MPSSRLHPRAATFARGPNLSLRSVLELSQLLDGFLRARACRLIPSRCHVQGLARSGASLVVQPPSLIARSLPPCRWLTNHSPACAGCRRSCASTSRLSSARGRVLSRARYSHARASLPSSSCSPSGSHFPRRAPAYLVLSALDVRSMGLRFRARPSRSSSAFPREKPDSSVSGLPACSSFRAFRPHLRRHETSPLLSSPSRDLVPSPRRRPPPGCPRDVHRRRPRRNHHPVAQMMISVPSLSDLQHHPGTQMMFRLGISEPSSPGCPCENFGSESPHSVLLQLPTGRPVRSRRLDIASPPGCPRDDSTSNRPRAPHRTVARVMIRPRVEAPTPVGFPSDASASSSPALTILSRLPPKKSRPPCGCPHDDHDHLTVARTMIPSSGHSPVITSRLPVR
jgi:hypothetical protein